MDGSWHSWLLVGKFQFKAPLNDGGIFWKVPFTPPLPNLTPFLCQFFNLPWKPSGFLNGLDNKAKWLLRDFPSSSHSPYYEKRYFQRVGKDKSCHQHNNIVYPQSFCRIVEGGNHFFHFGGKLQQFSLSSKNERSVKGGNGVNSFYEQ